MAMRLHITIDEATVAAVDDVAGERGRSRFIVSAVRSALENAARWEAIDSVSGALSDPHDWDSDPVAWVRSQRQDRPLAT